MIAMFADSHGQTLASEARHPMVLHVGKTHRTSPLFHAVFAVERLLRILMPFAVEEVATHASHPVHIFALTSFTRTVPVGQQLDLGPPKRGSLPYLHIVK